MMKFSVVIPSYNQADYLEQTILSVLAQNMPETEIVVMDGGSTDGSTDVIHRYEDRLSGWVSERDRGQADAVNKGIARTNGEIIAWLNSDDLYIRGTFEKVRRFFETHPDCDAVYGDVLSVDGSGALMNVMRFAPYTIRDLMSFRVISQPGVFFKRSLWEKYGGIDLSYAYLLDHKLWLQMFSHGKFEYLPEPLAAARFHAAAKNRAHTEDFGKEAYRLAEWMLQDPTLGPIAKTMQPGINGGAAWLDAHYLSDGGLPRKSLAAYARAFRSVPGRVLEDRNRVLLTLLMAVSPALSQKVFETRAAARLEGLRSYAQYLIGGPTA